MRAVMFFVLACGLAMAARAEGPSLGSDNAQALHGTQRVAIDEFGVEVVTALRATGRAAGSTAEVASRLVGPSAADFQALADKAYDGTVAALQAAGFEVVPKATLLADPGYQALAAKVGKASPYVLEERSGVNQIFAPAGMKAFFQTSGASGRGGFGDRTDALNVANGQAAAAVAKSLGATMLRFHFVVSYGTAAASKGFLANFTGRARASVKVEPNLASQETAMQFVTADGPRIFTSSTRSGVTGAVYLDKPYVVSADGFALADTTTEASKDADAAANATTSALAAARAVATGADQTAAQTHRSAGEVQVDPATLGERYAAMIAAARDAFVASLRAAK